MPLPVHISLCVSARFYFVGDEDLLEIIGNSKNVPKLQKHFKKMFAGVATVTLSEDESKVLGICSKEGEEVRYSYEHSGTEPLLALVPGYVECPI